MEKEMYLGQKDIVEQGNSFASYENVLGMLEVDKNFSPENIKKVENLGKETDMITLFWLEQGSCSLSINNKLIAMETHTCCFVSSLSDLQINTYTSDFNARVLIVKKSFMDECLPNKNIRSFYNRLFIKLWIKITLTQEESELINQSFHILKHKINEQKDSSFYKEFIYVSFKSFMFDLTHILNSREENNTLTFSRKEELFIQFMDLLLEHYKEEHEVGFYAEKLFVSPQYLTLIIKKLTGKTTNKWIDDTLLMEARKLLKTTQEPVQQIAYRLNFSDQSTFGKFFKKYLGMSPLEYRRLEHAPAVAI
ncbi:AraC family transcriptional activator of pobA [Parabacteroides sp. PFB2-12]|uniref:helix-turn-helix domain-containing protein n=1 Tax=unclassified Parabacteroides TaxID=2649774 RepID=UPI002472ED8D|nr:MULTISPECIES: AraC family transcriptional regulator [unclassified Parabacteroides]MDH6342867.1 AraC family transcriptional activator of pobA [Parabacteroides sp. PM6-13]MDH6390503.1 AraC family transcriptional activator of pobA [Parabacteroides sp. PFB2-12]